ncbi:MAG: HDOD domain-containing protein [Gammaproteobacteria bacterium]
MNREKSVKSSGRGTPAEPARKPESDGLALVARQPVYNSAMAVVAYELLYREESYARTAMMADTRRATLRVVANAALEIGLERLAGGLPIHINFPRELLVSEQQLPLQPDRVIIEVMEDVPADREVLAGIAALRARGHRIALDDYSARKSGRALLDVSDIVKVALSRDDLAELPRTVQELKARGLHLIAEDVETIEQFEKCIELGFDGFQGDFLQHPQTFAAQRAPSSKLGTLRLLTELSKEETSIGEVEQLVSQDMSMSYRVLRCINSSFYNLPRKVDSMRQAVVILGMDPLRQLCALVALQGFDDRPSNLLVVAMARARMCEQLGRLAGANDSGPYFITGLFSMLNVLTGIPIAKIVDELPLAPAVTQALISEDGDLGAALHCVRAYERGRWKDVAFSGLPHQVIRAAYVDAVFWAEQTRSLLLK